MRGGVEGKFHRERPDTWERISMRLAFLLAQGSTRFQSFGRISDSLVFQVRDDRPAGRGVLLRPCAKSSIKIPREAETKAFEQEAILNSVYKTCRRPVSISGLQKFSVRLWSFWYHPRT
jgi:hypothetical protein